MTSPEIEKIKEDLIAFGFNEFDDYTKNLSVFSQKEPNKLVEKIYSLFNLPTPEIQRAKNPYHFQLLINEVKENGNFNIGDKIQKFWIDLHANQLKDLTEKGTIYTTLAKTANNTFLSSFQNISRLVEEQIKSRLKPQNIGYTPFQSSFTFDQLGIFWLRKFYQLKFGIPLTETQKLFAEANIFWCYCTDNYFVYCPHPQTIVLDENNKLHHETGAAIKWDKNFELYVWRGIEVSKDLITQPQNITKEDIIGERNAEKRRIIQEKLGSERFGHLLGLVELDKDVDLQGNMQYLYRTKEFDTIAKDFLYFAKVSCPSTGRIYFLSVPPGLNNVWDAVAWTFGKDKESYRPIIET